ncbi:helix-turn-helix domain-containing protein [Parapusillimonas sp. JC17]|uniref:helix-turn-helix domain-containing protein n=1 Tax=Parapusillimonas sp. JC17 TaxID=3445768 RepID=UPI003FA096C4
MAIPKKKLLIIADDHPRIREALQHILTGLHGSTTLYSGGDPAELRRIADRRLDEAEELTVADVSLREAGPERKCAGVVAPGSHESPLMVVSVQERGITANWFVAIDAQPGQESDDTRIEAALDQRDVVMELIRGLRDAAQSTGGPEPEPLQETPSTESLMKLGLTQRQAEVLVLLAEGLANKEIARRLDISEWTVRHHVSSILERLEVSNRGKAAVLASRLAQVG